MGAPATTRPPSLARFTGAALWLGLVGFGGGFAVAQRLRRTAEARGWMAPGEFMEVFAVGAALPGTTAANLVSLLGQRLHGAAGAAAACGAFLAPSVALMIGFGAFYERMRSVATLASFMDGMSAATVGVIGAVTVEMARATLMRRLDWGLAIAATAALALSVLNLVEVVACAALVGAVALRPRLRRAAEQPEDFPPSSLRSVAVGLFAPVAATAFGPVLALFVVFARIGIFTFGGGFAMIPAIAHEVVGARGWLSEAAFNDAMVLGQITPGPVAIAATFIGFRVAGLAGAAAATLGMFGPPLVASIVVGRSLHAFRANAAVQGALRAIAPAVVGVIAAAAVALWRTSVHALPSGAIAIGALAVLVAWRKLSPLVPLAAGGVVMWLLRR